MRSFASPARNLLHPGGPTYEVVLDEFVLRRLAVPPVVMEKQLRHLIDVVSAEPRLTVRVLPVDALLVGGLLPKSSFTLYTFPDPDDPPMAIADTVNADLVYTDTKEVSRYTGHYERLKSASLSPAESLSLLGEIVDRLTD
jgi:Domain of unknown function (DUF5753)